MIKKYNDFIESVDNNRIVGENGILHDDNSMIIGHIHNKKITIPKYMINDMKKCASIGIYFEGPYPEEVVVDFIKNYNLSRKNMKSWEPSDVDSDELVLDLFGGDVDILIDQIKPDKNKPIIDFLVKNKSKWSLVSPTKKDIIELSSYIDGYEKALLEPFDVSIFKKFHRKAKVIVFNEDDKNSDNYLYKIQKKVNANRDKELMSKYKNGGLFFAGLSHLDKKYNKFLIR